MNRRNKSRTVIIGSTITAQEIARQLIHKQILGNVVGFVAETPTNVRSLEGVPILGSLSDLDSLLKTNCWDAALIALENTTTPALKKIFFQLKEAGVPDIRILPDIERIQEAEAHLIQTRKIGMEDLLGRTPVKICLKSSLTYLNGKRVMVTGAGGSIGRELCKQLLYGGAKRLYLFDHHENNLYEIDQELKALQEAGIGERATIVPIIGEIQDEFYINHLLNRTQAEVVFHTAAYKQVPLMEANPVEVFKNNFFGTYFLLKAAKKNKVEKLVFISTDKAVAPSSIYGVTKNLSEQLVLNEAQASGKDFMVVRFGNVLGSQGSIVPLFQKQIEKGGPITLTDSNIDRFFMTIPEASSLVLKAGGTGESGELYILDMGEPIKIIDLAKQMILLYGFTPEKDIPIKITGLREGEKLHECLWEKNQTVEPTSTEKINRLVNPLNSNIKIEALTDQLYPICFFDPDQESLYRNRIELKKRVALYFPQVAPTQKESNY